MRLHWHRRDLRVQDNRGLVASRDADPVLPVFVFDPELTSVASPPRLAFLCEAVAGLREAYRSRGSDLVVRRGAPEAILPDLAESVDAETVTWCRDYSGLARTRDERVTDALRADDVAVETVHDAVLVPPGEITSSAGTPYAVFSYYADKWHDRTHPTPVAAPDSSSLVDETVLPDRDHGGIPDCQTLGFEPPTADVPPASTDDALDRLDSFLDGPVFEYDERRDVPAADCTSRLSPHLRFGTIGVRTVYARSEQAKADAPDHESRDAVETFQEQLAWRDFYTETLAHNPEMIEVNLTAFEREIDWQWDPADFEAWTRGETGYPIVDAGLRQLRREAWMHNRARMIVASFLTKDLRIDWRRGYEWFRDRLVDHDPANDAGGWQWAASTGTDAQPFFRVFNPASQAEQYDPEGAYVREYVPELRDVPTAAIHDWPALSSETRTDLAPEYPDPIVAHDEAREAALAMFRRARGESPDGE